MLAIVLHDFALGLQQMRVGVGVLKGSGTPQSSHLGFLMLLSLLEIEVCCFFVLFFNYLYICGCIGASWLRAGFL